MIKSALIVIIIAVLALLAFRFAARHDAASCTGNCASCMSKSDADELCREIREAQEANKES